MTLTEEQRGTVAFDPEKARASIAHYRIENHSNVDTESAIKELVDQANLAEDAVAEIERLRPYEKVAADLAACGSYVGIGPGEGELPIPERVRRCVNRLKETQHEYEQKIISKDARIKKLEDAHKRSGAKYAKIINELRSSVYANIPGLDVGKIGPDAGIASSDHIVEADQTVGGRRCHI